MPYITDPITKLTTRLTTNNPILYLYNTTSTPHLKSNIKQWFIDNPTGYIPVNRKWQIQLVHYPLLKKLLREKYLKSIRVNGAGRTNQTILVRNNTNETR
jgi:hypothetical protein